MGELTKVQERLQAIRVSIKELESTDSWAGSQKLPLPLELTIRELGKPLPDRADAALWYPDGDLAALFHDNLGYSWRGEKMAQFLRSAICDVPSLLDLVEALLAERRYYPKWLDGDALKLAADAAIRKFEEGSCG